MVPDRLSVTLQVNGATHALFLEPRRSLLDVLRYDLALTGTKKVCDMGNCGACTVLLEGRAIYACLRLAVDCAGEQITTIEGLAQNGVLDPVQQAFIDADAFQCGFCTAGQIMSLKGLLQETPGPSEAQLVRAVTGNLCRCGAYPNILRAGRLAAARHAQTRETPMPIQHIQMLRGERDNETVQLMLDREAKNLAAGHRPPNRRWPTPYRCATTPTKFPLRNV